MKNNLRKNSQSGFTLIELLVVVAIIGLLSSVVLSSVAKAREKATDTKALQEMHQFQLAVQIFYSENGRYPDPGTSGSYCLASTGCQIGAQSISSASGELAQIIPQTPEDRTFAFVKKAEALIGSRLPGFLTKNPTISSGATTYAGPIYIWNDTTQQADVIFTTKNVLSGLSSYQALSSSVPMYQQAANGGTKNSSTVY